ncbi:alginate lyase family protein [Salinicoccus bachuensis]|uniref:Alginate lyase family protein n=1 Tax=Salinicoccus bachuensis TaxID=3136731 RepID=A0ABZ3CKA7_9STAP
MNIELVKNMGMRWLIYRSQYEVKKKFGYLKKTYPSKHLEDINIGYNIGKKTIRDRILSNFSELSKVDQLKPEDIFRLKVRADRIVEDKFHYFNDLENTYSYVAWNYSPKTRSHAPKDYHWSEISDFNSEFGDIKWIWELSRFTFTYDLARAYLYTGKDGYAEKFWRLFEDFIENNPLETGVNYKCSQEMSFRVNAWLFALYHFIDHPSSTEKRVINMVKSIAHYGNHIHKHINFSVEAVKNNHSISEATTLVVIGNTLDFLPNSNKLFRKGSKILKKEINWQIKSDGSFIQHSHNYHRLVLQNISWYLTSMKSVNKYISQTIVKKANLSIDYFMNVISAKGEVPNYGMNDGSYIMPLTERGYNDYRPVLQCLNYQLNNTLLFRDTSVNEILNLFNRTVSVEETDTKEHEPKDVAINHEGGYHTLKHGDFKVHVKSKSYKDRPAQADMNHVEIWWREQCIFCDAGTYSYNDNMGIINYFNGTPSHNTVLINDESQMKKGARFIWYNWSKSKKPEVKRKASEVRIEVELRNYGKYRHKRSVTIGYNEVVIIDQIVAPSDKDIADFKLQWLTELDVKVKENQLKLGEDEWKMTFASDNGGELITYYGSEEPFRGWVSSTYGEKHAANQIIYHTKTSNRSYNIKTILSKTEKV